jgi:hypothetical protein
VVTGDAVTVGIGFSAGYCVRKEDGFRFGVEVEF